MTRFIDEGRKLYEESVDRGPIHSNRERGWSELSRHEKFHWMRNVPGFMPRQSEGAAPVEPLPDEIVDAWESVSDAVDRLITSLPQDISAAIKRLEGAQDSMRDVLHLYGRRA